MWDLPGPGLEPVFPALAGRFLTTSPPGKSLNQLLMPVITLLYFIPSCFPHRCPSSSLPGLRYPVWVTAPRTYLLSFPHTGSEPLIGLDSSFWATAVTLILEQVPALPRPASPPNSFRIVQEGISAFSTSALGFRLG